MINGIPCEAFDPSKHLVECREVKEGRTVFVTLQSLMEAEDRIDAASAPQAAPDVSEVVSKVAQMIDAQGFVRPDALTELEERLARKLKDAVPPAQFPVDVLQTLSDTATALIAANKRIAELEATVATHTENFRAVAQLAGSGE